MNCRRCNAQIEDGAAFCMQCGEPAYAAKSAAVQAPQQEAATTKKKPKRAKTILIIAACAVVVACAVLIPVLIEKAKAEKYEAAFAMMEEGAAPQAYEEFTELAGYRDAESLANTCQNMTDYKEAKELMDKGDYAGAKTILVSLNDYEDSNVLAGDCQNTMDYNAATELMDGGDMEKARDAFLALGDYSDSAGLAGECQKSLDYDAAKALMKAGDFTAAQAAFAKVLDFNDSRKLMGDCYDEQQYIKAGQAFSQGKYYTAYEIYIELGDFKDSTEQAIKCVQPNPKSGQIYRNPDYKSKKCPLTIKTKKHEYSTFLRIYEKSSGKLVSSIFIAPGKKVTVKLPKGKYYISDAYGVKWFGAEEMYGDEGYYNEKMEIRYKGKTTTTMTLKAGYRSTLSLS